MTAKNAYDVFLDTGVSVALPPGMNEQSDEGHALLKRWRATKLIALLKSGTFDIVSEPLEERTTP